jgi:hypothetical protein
MTVGADQIRWHMGITRIALCPGSHMPVAVTGPPTAVDRKHPIARCQQCLHPAAAGSPGSPQRGIMVREHDIDARLRMAPGP